MFVNRSPLAVGVITFFITFLIAVFSTFLFGEYSAFGQVILNFGFLFALGTGSLAVLIAFLRSPKESKKEQESQNRGLSALAAAVLAFFTVIISLNIVSAIIGLIITPESEFSAFAFWYFQILEKWSLLLLFGPPIIVYYWRRGQISKARTSNIHVSNPVRENQTEKPKISAIGAPTINQIPSVSESEIKTERKIGEIPAFLRHDKDVVR